MAVNNRITVAKCVISGTLGEAGSTNEIWSTGFYVAEYTSAGGDTEMEDFDPSSYLTAHLQPFAAALLGNCQSYVHATLLKCNRFSLVGPSGGQPPRLVQQDDPTIQTVVSLTGTATSGGFIPYFAAFGWALSSSTAGTRGRASRGRMFFPPIGHSSGSGMIFTDTGRWDPTIVSQVSGSMSTAWDGLKATTGGTPAASTFLPSMVSIPTTTQYASDPHLLVNGADQTTAEFTVWSMRSRKNALPSGGTQTTHPSFD